MLAEIKHMSGTTVVIVSDSVNNVQIFAQFPRNEQIHNWVFDTVGSLLDRDNVSTGSYERFFEQRSTLLDTYSHVSNPRIRIVGVPPRDSLHKAWACHLNHLIDTYN